MTKNNSLFDLTNKIVLVTGATHGLGMAMAEGLGTAGAKLVINGNSSAEKISAAVDHYRELGIECHGYQFDVRDEEAVKESLNTIKREVGPIDILVNNAGIIQRTPLLEMELKDWKNIIDTDLTSAFIMGRAVAPDMIKRGAGKIINICSMMTELGRDSVGAYASAKGGLKMLTKSMATEWAKHNIQVNGIGPGYFATSQTEALRVDGHPFNQFIVNRTPAGRWGNPEELQGTAVYLSSAASNFVTGQIVYVDGGILATIGKPIED